MARPSDDDDTSATTSEKAARLLDAVKDLTAELHPGQTRLAPVGLDSSLDRDLGLDSLGRVELFSRLEGVFDIALPEQALLSAETPRDLLRAVLGAGAAKGTFRPPDVDGIDLGAAETPPPTVKTLNGVLDWHVSAHPERPHIRLAGSDGNDGNDREITFRALREGAGRIAAGLQQRGVGAGESVIIMLPTGEDYFYSFFGVLLAGGVPVPIYPPARPAQIEQHLLRHSAIFRNCLADILITVPEAKKATGLLKAQAETLRHVVTADELSSASPGFMTPAVGPNDTAFLQYTSGSTGDPKGVVLTHDNLLSNIRAMGETIGAGPGDVFVSWLPLYHDMGLIGAWLGSLHYAMMLVIMPPLSFLARPRRWLWAIHRYGGTLSAAPNFAYEQCLRRIGDEDIEGLDLSSWRIAFNGAEAVSPETIRRFCRRFARYGFREEALKPVYGLAESSVGLAFPPIDRGPLIDRIDRETFTVSGKAVPVGESDTRAKRVVACGQPLPGHQIRIVDGAGHELPERREGRLQFKGPSATSGYFRNAPATRDLFDGRWLESGDLAYIAGGDVFITGRRKDVIIRAGRNIYPEELEEAVGAIDGVRKGNVAVFGSGHREAGTERLVVLAETRRRDAGALEQLRARINATVTDLIGAPPDDVVLAPPRSVPKTSSGKIRRAASREIHEAGAIGKPGAAGWLRMTRLALAVGLAWLRRARRIVSGWLYGAYWWIRLVVLAPATWLLVILLPVASWRWSVVGAAATALLRAFGTSLTVQGLDNLPPPGRPCVYVSNHASYLDSAVLFSALPREFGFVTKAELIGQLVPRLFLNRIGAEFVDRFDKEKGLTDARRLVSRAKGGRSLLFFAEGTCQRMPGLLPFHMGAFTVAAEAGIPVVPITIRGTRVVLRSDTWLPRPGAITVIVDQAIEPETGKPGTGVWQAAMKLHDATRRRILTRSGEPDLVDEKVTVDSP